MMMSPITTGASNKRKRSTEDDDMTLDFDEFMPSPTCPIPNHVRAAKRKKWSGTAKHFDVLFSDELDRTLIFPDDAVLDSNKNNDDDDNPPSKKSKPKKKGNNNTTTASANNHDTYYCSFICQPTLLDWLANQKSLLSLRRSTTQSNRKSQILTPLVWKHLYPGFDLDLVNKCGKHKCLAKRKLNQTLNILSYELWEIDGLKATSKTHLSQKEIVEIFYAKARCFRPSIYRLLKKGLNALPLRAFDEEKCHTIWDEILEVLPVTEMKILMEFAATAKAAAGGGGGCGGRSGEDPEEMKDIDVGSTAKEETTTTDTTIPNSGGGGGGNGPGSKILEVETAEDYLTSKPI